MVEKRLPVLWDKQARTSLKEIYLYIKHRGSEAQAIKVRDKIKSLADSIQPMPLKHPMESILADIPGDQRFVRAWDYKIIYEINQSRILILDIFHVKRNPTQIRDLKK